MHCRFFLLLHSLPPLDLAFSAQKCRRTEDLARIHGCLFRAAACQRPGLSAVPLVTERLRTRNRRIRNSSSTACLGEEPTRTSTLIGFLLCTRLSKWKQRGEGFCAGRRQGGRSRAMTKRQGHGTCVRAVQRGFPVQFPTQTPYVIRSHCASTTSILASATGIRSLWPDSTAQKVANAPFVQLICEETKKNCCG